MKRIAYALGIIVMLFMAGCASKAAAAPTEAMMENTPTAAEMMASSTPEMMMDSATPDMMATSTPDMMMSTATPDAMMGGETSMAPTESMMMAENTPDAMQVNAAFLGASLTDAATGKAFKLSDFMGKVVLVELISTQNQASLDQQKSIQAYIAGSGKDLTVVSLDVAASETDANLKDHLSMNAFMWSYAKAPADLVSQIGMQFGSDFINPANTPLFVIDAMGDVHALALKLVSQMDITNALANYLPKM